MLNTGKKYNVRLYDDLIAFVDEGAKENGVAPSTYIRVLVAKCMSADKVAKGGQDGKNDKM